MWAVDLPAGVLVGPMATGMPPVVLSDGTQVLVSSLAWLLTSVAIGAWATRWSPERLADTGVVTTLRDWEDHGRWWQRNLRVRRWKDLVPEAGGVMPGGRSMRRLARPGREGLATFRAETVRAERVHWLIAASVVVHLVWCRGAVFAGMVLFAVVFNAPFIVIQRYNRGRIDGLLARRSAHG